MTRHVAVYAGSFDPPTDGHLWVIEKGAAIFERLIVTVAVNPAKQGLFSLDERVRMLQEITARRGNIEVVVLEEVRYLACFAAELGATHLLRGIRNVNDYVYEHGMRDVNADLAPELETVFVIPPAKMTAISSSVVKQLIGPPKWQEAVARYVPPAVLRALEEKFDG